MYEHIYEHCIYMLHTYSRMQLNVLCTYTNLQLHVSHATELGLQKTVAKPEISSSDILQKQVVLPFFPFVVQ
jgi:hypothetical protein